MKLETSEYMRHIGGHFSEYEAIPTHTHHVSIFFQQVIPRDKSFATHRADFSSNYVSEKENMNLINVREFFVHHFPKKKNLFQFLHNIHGFGEMSKTSLASGGLMHFWSDLGKIKISPNLDVKMTLLII